MGNIGGIAEASHQGFELEDDDSSQYGITEWVGPIRTKRSAEPNPQFGFGGGFGGGRFGGRFGGRHRNRHHHRRRHHGRGGIGFGYYPGLGFGITLGNGGYGGGYGY